MATENLKDYTVVIGSRYSHKAGKVLTSEAKTYYKNVSHPKSLPLAAYCDETVKEWEDWHRAHNTEAWKEYSHGN